MKTIFLAILFSFGILSSFAQEIALTFTARDAGTQNNIVLSSVLVENLTIGCDTIVPGPDPLLVVPVIFGLHENDPGGMHTFRIVSNTPNPFSGK
ncbi:MAG: hypothetical protein MUC31_01195, partial [Bacteroidales bacterium]|nr:hypothetical protein [Bacteroidales bacterium]